MSRSLPSISFEVTWEGMLYFTCLLAFAPMVYAVIETIPTTENTFTTTHPPMTFNVWRTSTLPGGQTTVWEGAFTQQFSQLWSTIQAPKSGQIGLGKIQGQVGTVRAEPAHPAPT